MRRLASFFPEGRPNSGLIFEIGFDFDSECGLKESIAGKWVVQAKMTDFWDVASGSGPR